MLLLCGHILKTGQTDELRLGEGWTGDIFTHLIFFCFLLGALTKGDRRAATGADLTQFNFDTPYGRSALRNMYQSITLVC